MGDLNSHNVVGVNGVMHIHGMHATYSKLMVNIVNNVHVTRRNLSIQTEQIDKMKSYQKYKTRKPSLIILKRRKPNWEPL